VKKDKFQLFLEQSKFSSSILNNAQLSYVLVDEKTKKWTFDFILSDMIDPEVLLPFVEQLRSYFRVPRVVTKIDVNITYKNISKLNELACKYYDYNHI
jgi:DNA polymerase III subunit alpha, Gram-positive type